MGLRTYSVVKTKYYPEGKYKSPLTCVSSVTMGGCEALVRRQKVTEDGLFLRTTEAEVKGFEARMYELMSRRKVRLFEAHQGRGREADDPGPGYEGQKKGPARLTSSLHIPCP